MKTSFTFLLLFLSCVPVVVRAQASTASPNVQQTQLGPEPKVIVISAKATLVGVSLEIQAQHLGAMGFWFEREDKSTGEWIQIISSLQVPVPAELRDTNVLTGSSPVLPVLLPDKNTSYRVGVFGKATADDPRDWTYSNLQKFSGFDNIQKPLANSINLQFSDQSLKIATETEDKAILKASWQVGGHTGFGLQATANQQNPVVDLNYAAIPKESSGAFPAIDIALVDESGHTLQEAKIAVKVTANQSVTTKVAAVKDQPANSSQGANTKFSWSDLARTGIGALMKFFMAI